MGICAANMRSCDKKAKCIFGPNEGIAYNPKDPCCGQGVFNNNTCDCEIEAARRWVIDYLRGDGDPGRAPCPDGINPCVPYEAVAFDSISFWIPNHEMTPADSGSFCSLSEACPNGPYNCKTWTEITGADYVYISRTTPLSGDTDAPCGISDSLFQNFTIVSGPTYPPGTIISFYFSVGWGGAVGCCFNQFQVLDVYPFEAEE